MSYKIPYIVLPGRTFVNPLKMVENQIGGKL